MKLLATLCLLFVAACRASALTCNECSYVVVMKGDNSGNEAVQEALDALTHQTNDSTTNNDEECRKHGDDYTLSTTHTCPASVSHCEKLHGFMKFTMYTVECEVEYYTRECLNIDQTALIGCDQDSSYYEGLLLELPGVTSAEISGDFCYCSGDLCNAALVVTVSTLAVLLAIIAAAVLN